MAENEGSVRAWVAAQSEEALGKLVQELLNHPATHHTIAAAFEARERVGRAQELAMSALNLPSAADLERLTRRIRSVSQRVEGIEEGLDRLVERLETTGADAALTSRLDAIEQGLRDLRVTLDTQHQGQGDGQSDAVENRSGAVDGSPAANDADDGAAASTADEPDA